MILWYVFKGKYDGVLTSFNQCFCECNSHELNILMLEFIETSPCSIKQSMISYSIGDIVSYYDIDNMIDKYRLFS